MASFVLSDGERELEFAFTSPDGIFLQDLTLPVVSKEVTFAETPDGEGRRPLRKRAQSPAGAVKFAISAFDSTPFWDYVDDVQDLVASMDRSDAATVRYEPPEGEAVTYEVTDITLTGIPQSGAMLSRYVVEDCEIQFECAPYGLLDPVEIFTEEEFAGSIDTKEVVGVPGHVEAWGALTFEDPDSQSRGFLEVGQAFDYDDDQDLQLALPDLVLTDTGGSSATRAGSLSTNVVRATFSTGSATVCKSDRLTHRGRKRVRARVFASAAAVQVRIAWRVGDASYSYSPWRTVPAVSTWVDMVVDNVLIKQVPVGDHFWDFRIEARTNAGMETIDVDFVTLFPADQYSVCRQIDDLTGLSILLSDDFNQSSGDYTGKSMDIGGSVSSGGDGNDFVLDTANHRISRTATGDTDLTGRYVYAGNAMTDCIVSASPYPVESPTGSGGKFRRGVLFRYVDANNYALAFAEADTSVSPAVYTLKIYKVVATVKTLVASVVVSASTPSAYGAPLTVTARSNGDVSVSRDAYRVEGNDAVFATGGALASGKAGIYDELSGGTSAGTRGFDDFRASSLDPPQPVMHDSGAVLLTHNAALRESSDGNSLGAIQGFRGKHLTLPPATRNGKRTLLAVRSRRFNVDDGRPDTGLSDALTGSLVVTPRVLLLPG